MEQKKLFLFFSLLPDKINTNLFIFYTIKNKLEIKRINNCFLKFVFQREVFNDI